MSEFNWVTFVASAYRAYFDLDPANLKVIHEEEERGRLKYHTVLVTFPYRLSVHSILQSVTNSCLFDQTLSRQLLTEANSQICFEVSVYDGEVQLTRPPTLQDLCCLGSNIAWEHSNRVELIEIRTMRKALDFVKSILDASGQDPNEEHGPAPRTPAHVLLPR